MNTGISRRMTLLAAALALVLAASIILFATMSRGADANSQLYELNESGLSFGKIGDTPQGSEMPDLISAVATNGKAGYIYSKDLNAAAGIPANPDEAVKLMNERLVRESRLFAAALAAKTGTEISIDDDSAMSAYAMVQDYMLPSNPSTDWKPEDRVIANIASMLGIDRGLLPSGDDAREFFAGILAEVQSDTMKEIPVYAEDGKTIIGAITVGG